MKSDEAKLSIYRDEGVAERYDERWSGAAGKRRDERTRQAVERALVGLGEVRSVLDAPCGAGRYSAWLGGAFERYVGADAAEAMLRQARTKTQRPLVVCDLSRLPFADRSFDAAVCVRLMHLVRDSGLRRSFLSELARVSRRGVVVDYLQAESVKNWLARSRASIGLRDHGPNALTRTELRAELASAGLERIEFQPLRSFSWLSDKIVVAARVQP